MNSTNELSILVFSFLEECEGFFSIRELLETMKLDVTPDIVNAVFGVLMDYEFAYMLPDDIGGELIDRVWISKDLFFSEKKFVVAPTEFEIEQGILILGSRFSWASGLQVKANYTNLVFNSELLPHETTEIHNEFVPTYYFLYNDNMLVNELCFECEKNIPRVLKFNPNTFFYVTSVNISELYEALNFKLGDRLLFCIEDFPTGTIELLPKKAPKTNKDDVVFWKEAFNEAVTASCKIMGPDFSTQGIIAFAFFLGADSLFAKKSIALEEALFENEEIKCVSYGLESIIWPTAYLIPIQGYWSNILPNNSSKINKFFRKIHVPITKSILKVIIDDFLANNYLRSNEKKEIKLFCRDIALTIIPKVAKRKYVKRVVTTQKIIFKLYRRVKQKYNRFSETDELIKFRQKVVSYFLDAVQFVNNLDKKKLYPNSFENQSGLVMDQMLIQAIDFIQSVATVYNQSQNNFSEYMISITNIMDIYETVKTEIINQMKQKF